MTPAERLFKRGVRELIRHGVHPTPGKLKTWLCLVGGPHNLNGRQCRWLRRDMRVPAIREGYPYSGRCQWKCCQPDGGIPDNEGRRL